MKKVAHAWYDEHYYKKSEGIDFTKSRCYRRMCALFCRCKGTFVDLGCGIGNQLKPFEGRFPHLVGIDISMVALRKAKRSLSTAEFILADARFLPLRDQSTDAWICISTLEHLTIMDSRRVLKEAYRVSKPRATGIIITPKADSLIYKLNLCYDPSHIHLFAVDEIRDILVSVGFNIRRILFSSLTQKLGPFGRLLNCEIFCVVQRGV